jgi:hypothetical protein
MRNNNNEYICPRKLNRKRSSASLAQKVSPTTRTMPYCNQATGKLEVIVNETRLIIIPKQVKQAKRNQKAQINIHHNNTVTLITAQGREILVQIQ